MQCSGEEEKNRKYVLYICKTVPAVTHGQALSVLKSSGSIVSLSIYSLDDELQHFVRNIVDESIDELDQEAIKVCVVVLPGALSTWLKHIPIHAHTNLQILQTHTLTHSHTN